MRLVTALLALVSLSACAPDSEGVSLAAPTSNRALARGPMGVIVVLKSGDPKDIARSVGVSPKHVYTHAIKGFAAVLSDAAVVALSHNPNVQYVEPDQIMTTSETWGLDRIDQRALPLDNAYTTDRTGSGVHAYIIDSGINPSHVDFTGRIGAGADFTGSGNTDDCLGHGTHVSGTVGGTTYGVAKRVTLHPVRVFPCVGSAATSTVVAAMDWVAANHTGPCVVNMSLGGDPSSAMDAAVASLSAGGCTVAVAAGNSNSDACYASPARAPSAITVGATDITDTRASFSNWGDCVDLFAPGKAITSDWYTSSTATATISGTSMASPHVAGVVALLLEGNPGLSASAVQDSIKAYSTKNVVQNALSQNWNLLYSGRVIDDGYIPAPPNPAPDAPSRMAYEIDPFGDGNQTLVLFTWKDNSFNEVYFELELNSAAGERLVSLLGANTEHEYWSLSSHPGNWTAHVRAKNSSGVSAWSHEVSFCIPGGSTVCKGGGPKRQTRGNR